MYLKDHLKDTHDQMLSDRGISGTIENVGPKVIDQEACVDSCTVIDAGSGQ